MTARIIALAASLPRGLRARPWPAFCSRSRSPTACGMWMQRHARRRGRLRALRAAAAPPLAARLDARAPARVHVRLARARPDQAPRRSAAGRRSAARPRGALTGRRTPRSRSASPWPSPTRCTPALFADHHGGPDLPFALHMARDALVAFAARASLSRARRVRHGAPHARGPRPGRARWRVPVRMRRASCCGRALAPSSSAAPPRLRRHHRAARRRRRRPGRAVPRRRHRASSFDVQAIDVDIPLNRFGDHDPLGKMYVLTEQGRRRSRAEERASKVSIGLRDDPIQPLVIRANEGDCVEITFTNNATGGDYGMHIDGLAFDVGSSGDAIGDNAASRRRAGATTHLPLLRARGPDARGRALHPPRPRLPRRGRARPLRRARGRAAGLDVPEIADRRAASSPAGRPSSSRATAASRPSASPSQTATTRSATRSFKIPDGHGDDAPARRPAHRLLPAAARARSTTAPSRSCNRLEPRRQARSRSPTAPTPSATRRRRCMRGYLATRRRSGSCTAAARCSTSSTCTAAASAGASTRSPTRRTTTPTPASTSTRRRSSRRPQRLDSQAIGPGESYNLEIEGGAGGVQQGAGDFLVPLPHRRALHLGHVGLLAGLRHAPARPGAAARPRRRNARRGGRLPRPDRPDDATDGDHADQGQPRRLDQAAAAAAGRAETDQDAAVWNWTVDNSDPASPSTSASRRTRPRGRTCSDLDDGQPHPGHPALPGRHRPSADRPVILLQPGQRPARLPAAAPAHRPAQARSRRTATPVRRGSATNGRSPRRDGRRRPVRRPHGRPLPGRRAERARSTCAIQLPIRSRPTCDATPTGTIFVLDKDKADVLAGRKPAAAAGHPRQHRRLRRVTLTNESTTTSDVRPFTKVEHAHPPRAVRHPGLRRRRAPACLRPVDPPVQARGPEPDRGRRRGAAHDPAVDERRRSSRTASWIAVGEGTEDIEIRQITRSTGATTVTLGRAARATRTPRARAPAPSSPSTAGIPTSSSTTSSGTTTWTASTAGATASSASSSSSRRARPSTTRKTGEQVDSGTIVDIHTPRPALAPGPGRRLLPRAGAVDDRRQPDHRLDAQPARRAVQRPPGSGDRPVAAVLAPTSYGDPNTPLPRAYPGDPFVIRTINVRARASTRCTSTATASCTENRFTGRGRQAAATPTDGLHYGISERYTAILDGGAGGGSSSRATTCT